MIGNFSFVLHTHLPYVLNHGIWPHGMDWLNEAAAECYIPIINILYRLKDEGYVPHLTIGITPVLTEQLASKVFQESFITYLNNKIDAAQNDYKLFNSLGNDHRSNLAKMWENFYSNILNDFDNKFNRNLVGAFKSLQDENIIEIITCAATHGYLPLIGDDECVQAQIKMGIKNYKKHYGRDPIGIWLPECAYRPAYKWERPVRSEVPPIDRKGIEEILSENGLRYFIIDTHLLKGGEAVGVYAMRFKALEKLWEIFKEQYTPDPIDINKTPYTTYILHPKEEMEPVTVFTRDPRTSIQLWSAEHGYPGDGWYLEFHKKHYPGGLRYWRVTSAKSSLGDKFEYYPDKVDDRIKENAGHFKSLINELLRGHFEKSPNVPGIVVAPYDSELFGHWWWEGPRFLYYVLKWTQEDPEIELTTCGRFMEKYPASTIIKIPEGSWGEGQGHWIWLNEWTEWTWEKIYECEDKMVELVKKYHKNEDENVKKILKQLGRELFLLESSDWQFLISTWSARDYAENRVAEHYSRFKRLAKMVETYCSQEQVYEGDWNYLGLLEKEDRLFEEIDIEFWINK
ncbi:MAG: glycoside hydrolase family 57 protein [Candidatus Helarchaeota archaeon]